MKKLILSIFVAGMTLAAFGQGVPYPPPPGDNNGCLKVVKNGFVDCWDCWGEVACSNELRSSGCFGDCAKDCGVCVQFTQGVDGLFTMNVFDTDGNLVESISGVTGIYPVTIEADGHTFVRYYYYL